MNEILETLNGLREIVQSETPQMLIPVGLAVIVGTWHSLRENVKGKSGLGRNHALAFCGTGIASYLIAKGYGGSGPDATGATLLGLYAYYESYLQVDARIKECLIKKEDIDEVSGIDKLEEDSN